MDRLAFLQQRSPRLWRPLATPSNVPTVTERLSCRLRREQRRAWFSLASEGWSGAAHAESPNSYQARAFNRRGHRRAASPGMLALQEPPWVTAGGEGQAPGARPGRSGSRWCGLFHHRCFRGAAWRAKIRRAVAAGDGLLRLRRPPIAAAQRDRYPQLRQAESCSAERGAGWFALGVPHVSQEGRIKRMPVRVVVRVWEETVITGCRRSVCGTL